jgi:hypothetical protein
VFEGKIMRRIFDLRERTWRTTKNYIIGFINVAFTKYY